MSENQHNKPKTENIMGFDPSLLTVTTKRKKCDYTDTLGSRSKCSEGNGTKTQKNLKLPLTPNTNQFLRKRPLLASVSGCSELLVSCKMEEHGWKIRSNSYPARIHQISLNTAIERGTCKSFSVQHDGLNRKNLGGLGIQSCIQFLFSINKGFNTFLNWLSHLNLKVRNG